MRPLRTAFPLSIVLLSLLPGSALATPYADISTAGPLTHIYLGNELSCQVDRSGSKQLYPTGTTPGDCGTFAAYDGTLYKPDFVGHGGGTATNMNGIGAIVTPVSQTAVTGAGTVASPYKVVTVVAAGAKLRLTQTETYVTGQDYWTAKLDVENVDGSPVTASIYRGMDCYLGGSDSGYGYQDGASGGAGCSTNANNSPANLVEALIPAVGQGAVSYQARWDVVWTKVKTLATLDGTCACGSLLDNGVALQWQLNLAAGATETLRWVTLFSPDGEVPAPPPVAPPATVSPPAPAPVPSGTPVPGTAISVAPGTWTDADEVARRWQRCTSTDTGSCADIPGATGLSYTPGPDDVGHYLRVVETASNSAGSIELASALTAQISAAASEPAAETQPASGSASPEPTSPAPDQCVSRRGMRLHWTVPAGTRMRSFKVTLNGAKVATLRGKARAASVSLRGRPAGNFTVAVRGTTAAGRTLGTTRTYRTCAGKVPGKLRTLRLARVRR